MSFIVVRHAEHYPSESQAYDADMEASTEMLIDPDDYVNGQPESEKDSVVIINPDQLDGDVEMTDQPRADDCMPLLPLRAIEAAR
jgi:hypothetical protein